MISKAFIYCDDFVAILGWRTLFESCLSEMYVQLNSLVNDFTFDGHLAEIVLLWKSDKEILGMGCNFKSGIPIVPSECFWTYCLNHLTYMFFFSLFYLSRNPGLNLFLYIIIIDFMGVLLHSESIEYICIFINGKEDKIITYLITHHQCLYHSWFCLCSQNWKKCRRKLELSND